MSEDVAAMDEFELTPDQYYIRATSSSAEQTTRALKNGETFVITDRHGDIRPLGFEDHGLFSHGTRFLSRSILTIEDKSALYLSSTITRDNNTLMVDLTNNDFETATGQTVRKGSIHIHRRVFLHEDRCFERLRVTNFALEPVEFLFGLRFDADFVDIFEVRGMKRNQRGIKVMPTVGESHVVLPYHGLDGVARRSRLDFSPRPESLRSNRARFRVRLGPREETFCYVTTTCETDGDSGSPMSFDRALTEAERLIDAHEQGMCSITTSNEQFNDWINRSRSDVLMMLTYKDEGPYPYAGVPWYSTVFGRDGIITAMEMLWVHPAIARGVLTHLALEQAVTNDPSRDAEPGKIIHEMRTSEMANLGEIPFGRYYGTVDATPLFLMLAGRYYQMTGDLSFVGELWPNILRALEWIDTFGDLDHDGFVEYRRETATGLANQGWKDSDDSIFHADGRLAEAPIALCEVQGYVYEAKQQVARMASSMGESNLALRLRREVRELRGKFLRDFWLPDLGTYALALDGEKRPCRVRTSNAGHALFTGLASVDHAPILVQTLMQDQSFADWGVRTVATTEARYNPMSYHNGSIWPHDNAMIAYGMARYGFRNEAMQILSGMYQASLFLDLHRLPELFCGFRRRRGGEGPTLYPVACNPQAWAAGGAFMLLQACLGMRISALDNTLYINYPMLPQSLSEVRVERLRVGKSMVSFVVERRAKGVTVYLTEREGDARVMVTQ